MIEVWLARVASGGPRPSAEPLARAVLARRLGLEPGAIVIGRLCPRCGATSHGRPYLKDAPREVQLSLSSAGQWMGVALAAVPLGLDMVLLDEVVPDAFAAVLAPGEHAHGRLGVARVWARKEALLKATGDGLAVDPRTVRVSPDDAPAALVAWPRGRTDGVHLADLDLGPVAAPDLVGAVSWLGGGPSRVVVHPDATASLRER